MNTTMGIVSLAALALVTSAAVSAFGWHYGLAIGAAVWLLMPYAKS